MLITYLLSPVTVFLPQQQLSLQESSVSFPQEPHASVQLANQRLNVVVQF